MIGTSFSLSLILELSQMIIFQTINLAIFFRLVYYSND